MTCTIESKSKRHLPAKLWAGLAISGVLVLGTFVASASAEERRGIQHRGGGYGGYGGSYYVAPPLVYGSPYYNSYYGSPYYAPYYYPPPVIYGPGIGISLPGIGISIY